MKTKKPATLKLFLNKDSVRRLTREENRLVAGGQYGASTYSDCNYNCTVQTGLYACGR